jgi:hypothetical protein
VGHNGPHDALVVERPEVLQAAAAAGQDRDLGGVAAAPLGAALLDPPFEAAERADDAGRRLVALDLAGDEHDLGQRPAPRQDVADIAPDDAGRAGDDGDRGRPGRERPLARRVEQAFLGELRLERLESERQIAEARRLDGLDVELEGALRLEQVDPPVNDDPEAGLGLERRSHPLVAEPDALERAAVVLEAEVRVARGADGHPADFALDPHVPETLVRPNGVADGPGDLTDAEDLQTERAGRRAGLGRDRAGVGTGSSVVGSVPAREKALGPRVRHGEIIAGRRNRGGGRHERPAIQATNDGWIGTVNRRVGRRSDRRAFRLAHERARKDPRAQPVRRYER